jgi:hypothetical protein
LRISRSNGPSKIDNYFTKSSLGLGDINYFSFFFLGKNPSVLIKT